MRILQNAFLIVDTFLCQLLISLQSYELWGDQSNKAKRQGKSKWHSSFMLNTAYKNMMEIIDGHDHENIKTLE